MVDNLMLYRSNNNENGVTYTKKDPNKSPYYTQVFPSLTEKAHQYKEDFDTYNAGDWTVTETQAGATQALANEDGGVLVITNTATDNDEVSMQKVGENFSFTAGNRLSFSARFKIDEVIESDLLIGLEATSLTPLAPTDGAVFFKVDGSAALAFAIIKAGVVTSVTNLFTLVDDTYVTVGFYYNGQGTLEYYVNGSKMGTLTDLTNLPIVTLTPTIVVANGEGVAKVMSVDYIEAIKAQIRAQ